MKQKYTAIDCPKAQGHFKTFFKSYLNYRKLHYSSGGAEFTMSTTCNKVYYTKFHIIAYNGEYQRKYHPRTTY